MVPIAIHQKFRGCRDNSIELVFRVSKPEIKQWIKRMESLCCSHTRTTKLNKEIGKEISNKDKCTIDKKE
jgi:hypothetical protein